MTITSESRVGQLATTHPLATRVFARHGIDFCCGGGVTLAKACEKKGLDAATVVAEIERDLKSDDTNPQRWDQVPVSELIEHILTAYHQPLKEELPRLDGMAQKVLEVHREKDPEMLAELASVFTGLRVELEEHLLKEEEILFPMIRQGRGAAADGPIAVMMHEHEDAGAALLRLRELTHDYTVPAEACNTWQALWHGLAALESDLHHHIHLEHNRLFPQALAGTSGPEV